jgi:hypothetical protein
MSRDIQKVLLLSLFILNCLFFLAVAYAAGKNSYDERIKYDSCALFHFLFVLCSTGPP